MYTKMDRRIADAYNYGTCKELEAIQEELLNSRQKLSEFIDMFLDKCDNKMSHPLTSSNDPTWVLFRKKHEEYGEVERLLKSVNYFIAKV